MSSKKPKTSSGTTGNSWQRPSSSVLRSKISGLLLDGKFSDLILRCEGEEFRVHKCIVCTFSPVLAAACDGNFQEAIDKSIEVSVISKSTLQRMLKYFYTENYDEPPPHRKSKNTKQRTTPAEEDQNSDSSSDEECADQTKTTSRLMAHAQVCIAADYYQVPTLMDLALKKLKNAASYSRPTQFRRVIPLVYNFSSNSESRMRSSLCSTVVDNADVLLADRSIVDVIVSLPEFMKDFLPGWIKYGKCSYCRERDK